MEPGLSSWKTSLPRGRPILWHRLYGLLGPRQQQGEELRPAFAVDDAVDQVRPEPALECDHRLLSVGHVIAEALQREQEAGVGPIRVDQVARGAWKREAALRERVPGKQLARILLAGWSDIGMADDIAAADAMPLLDVGDEGDQRRYLLVGERTI